MCCIFVCLFAFVRVNVSMCFSKPVQSVRCACLFYAVLNKKALVELMKSSGIETKELCSKEGTRRLL